MEAIVTTKGLCKAYGTHFAVDGLDMLVPQGCVYGFIGPNGAGKSTTMKLLLGLATPSAGSITLMGTPLDRKGRLGLLRQTGSLIESPACYAHLSAQANLEIVAGLKDVPRTDISRVLEIVHLEKDRNRKVGQFSLGMKQRLGIAQALLGNPRLLILDEPTNGLDPAGIQEMRALIAAMPRLCGATVLVSSHLLGEMEQMVEQVGIINHGRLLFQGPLTQLQQHSRGNISLRVLDAAKAEAVLQASGITPTHEKGELILPPLRDEYLAELARTLADKGAGLVGLRIQTKSLEDIFLGLTAAQSAPAAPEGKAV
ncbi:MAG: ABC transporter ATP-binding protein [Gemmiger sp.]|nr:ABC transporter ATP-binding protein [Gemmiger sp.]